jgi:hypothetical protein
MTTEFKDTTEGIQRTNQNTSSMLVGYTVVWLMAIGRSFQL